MNRHSPQNCRRGAHYSFFIMMVLALLTYTMQVGAKPGQGNGPPQGFQPELRILWEVPLEASFSQVRPAVGPDGTIYAVDAADNLYIVPPDGPPGGDPTLVQKVPNAGSKGVDVSPDGSTVYTGNEDWIKAFNTIDGSDKWTFVQVPRAFILADVAVGPDGNVYALASEGMGIFSLEDVGNGAVVRWQNPESYDRSNALYTEFAFGPASDGDQLYFRGNQDTRGLKLSDGSDVFRQAEGPDRPVVSPFDHSWHRSDSAYNPDGTQLWEFTDFPPATGATVPALGTDGTHYTVNQGFRLFAIDPFGSQLWSAELDENVGAPDVDPSNTQLIMPTALTSTSPAALKTVSTNDGSDLWRVELPLTDPPVVGLQFVDTPLAFSPSGDAAYVISGVAGGNAVLYAISLDPDIPPASSILRIRDVTLEAKKRGRELSFTGEVLVTDENLVPISDVTVQATWTLNNGLLESQEATTGRKGVAIFKVTGEGGLYTLTVDDTADGVMKDDYTYDPEHSDLSGRLFSF